MALTPRPQPQPPPRLLLVGAGHAHLEILRRLATEEHPPVRLTLVSAFDRHHYSGMAPGYLAGLYQEEDLAFDLAGLAAGAGGELTVGTAVALAPGERRVALADGRSLAYDLVSFNVGSRTDGEDEVPGVAEHALTVKPLSKTVEVSRRLVELAAEAAGGGRPRVVVVGGGAGGVELAFAAAARLARARGSRTAGGDVTLIESGGRILAGYPPRFRGLALRTLARRGVEARTGHAVQRVGPRGVETRPADRAEDRAATTVIAASLTLWLTGAAAPALFRGSGLPLDRRGFLLIDGTLRSPADPRVFAAGDCATLADHPDTPKAGVYAVREAPVLWQSLLATLRAGDPATAGVGYEPQGGFLSLLNSCDGRALLSWKGLAARGRWVWWLKDRIDRRFVARYQRAAARAADGATRASGRADARGR